MQTNPQPASPLDASPANLSPLERRIDMTVPMAEIDKDVEHRLKKMSRTVKMPGFRPGKVPFKMVEQQYGAQARSEAIGEAVLSSNMALKPAPKPSAKRSRRLLAPPCASRTCAWPAIRASSRKAAKMPPSWCFPRFSRFTPM